MIITMIYRYFIDGNKTKLGRMRLQKNNKNTENL